MDDLFVFHELKPLNHLITDPFQEGLLQYWLAFLMYAYVLVKIHVEVLKYDDDVLAEVEAVLELHYPLVAFVVRALVLVHLVQLGEEFNFNVRVVNVKLFVFANFGSDDSLVWISVIYAGHDLAKGAFVNDFPHEVPVTQLFTNSRHVKAILVRYRVLVLPPNVTDRVNSQIVSQFNFFELRQLVPEYLKGFLGAPSIKCLVSLHLHCILAA